MDGMPVSSRLVLSGVENMFEERYFFAMSESSNLKSVAFHAHVANDIAFKRTRTLFSI